MLFRTHQFHVRESLDDGFARLTQFNKNLLHLVQFQLLPDNGCPQTEDSYRVTTFHRASVALTSHCDDPTSQIREEIGDDHSDSIHNNPLMSF